MKAREQALSEWEILKQGIKDRSSRELLKDTLYRIFLTLDSKMASQSRGYESVLDKYKIDLPEEIENIISKRVIDGSGSVEFYLKRFYYYPVMSLIKD